LRVTGHSKGNKDTVRKKYVAEVSRRLGDGCRKEGSVEEKWQEKGTSVRRKTDWFEESAGVLRPLLEKRRGAYLKWLDTGNERWRRGEVPSDWCDAVFIPFPKKEDLSHCDNWRGISRLGVVGKVVARVLKE